MAKNDLLTELDVRGLRAGKKRSDSTKLPGGGRLIVRAKKTQEGVVREFFFRYRGTGDRTIAIGRHGTGTNGRTVSLKQAREKAGELSRLLVEKKDPQVQRVIQQAENRRIEQAKLDAIQQEARKGTLSDLIASYVKHLEAGGKASADDTKKSLDRHVLKPFPALAVKKARDVTPEDITDVLARMIAKSIERRTNIVRAMLRAAFAHGVGLDNDPARKAEALKTGVESKLFGIIGNPVADIPRKSDYDKQGDRVLEDEELRDYVSKLSSLHIAVRSALQVALLLGGQRMTQLLRTKWADYDADDAVLSLKDPKGRAGARHHRIPIGDRVAAILETLKAITKEGPYIFSTKNGKKPIDLSTLSNAVSDIGVKIDKSDPPNPFTAADLRRTAETRLAALGVSKDHRAQLLSHGRTQGVQEKHYDRHDYLPEKAAALSKWEQHLDEVLTGKVENVIRGRFRRRNG
jgi:integrase